MAAIRRFDIDDVLNRPGTYVNPQTEVLIVVDDSTTVDAELLQEGDDEGEWILVSDEAPVDEARRDELVERLQRRAQATSRPVTPLDADAEADEEVEDPDFASAGFDDPSSYADDDEADDDY